MVVQFKERECGFHTVVFNGYGHVKNDIGNYKNETYESMFKLIAREINNGIQTIITEYNWLGEITTKRYLQEVRCYNYPSSIWAGRAVHDLQRGKSVLKINLTHIIASSLAGMDMKKRLFELVAHELAHIFYTYRPEFSTKWHAFVNEIKKPVDDYSLEYKDKWDSNLFANEIHSIMSEFLIAKKDMIHVYDNEAFEIYKAKYIEMHQ